MENEICYKKFEKPDASWAEYDCESCNGRFNESNCGGEYFYTEKEKNKWQIDTKQSNGMS